MQSSMLAIHNYKTLNSLEKKLTYDRKHQKESISISVPDILVNPDNYECRYIVVEDAREYYLDTINRLRSAPLVHNNIMQSKSNVGSTCLIDLRSQAIVNGQHGTFLSLIPWMNYYVRELGCRNIVLLPLGPYGTTRTKGADGSLFSLNDHLGVDDKYADTLVSGLSVNDQYRAVIEAAAIAGVRVGTVQPLATAALDYPAFARDPSLTFWWVADPGEVMYAPVIEEWKPHSLASCVERSPYKSHIVNRPELPRSYVERFVEPPSRSSIRVVHREEGSYFVGRSLYKGRMVDVAIANAIPDVIPDNVNQYAWSDIALLNYWKTHIPCPAMLMGFVEQNANSSALNKMKNVMRTRSQRYGESIFWIDMARCLPVEVRESAPKSTYTFKTTKLIYEQITGNSPIWSDCSGTVIGDFLCEVAPRVKTRAEFRALLFRFLSTTGVQQLYTDYLAGAGTHDAIPPEPRISAMLILLASILPGAQMLIVSGQERFTSKPINAEFGNMDSRYNENSMSLFSCDTKSPIQGVSADDLADKYNLPSMSRLLEPIVLLQEYVQRCRKISPPTFKKHRVKSLGQNKTGHWSTGSKPNEPWCTVIIQVDDASRGIVKCEKDWKIMLKPMVSDGWQVQRIQAGQYITLDAVDMVIVGGDQLATLWKENFTRA